MTDYGNVILNIFSLVLLTVVFVNMHNSTGAYLPDQKLFLFMCISDACILIFDSMQWICDGHPGLIMYYVNLISNFLYYSFQLVPFILWCLYVRYQLSMDVNETMKAKVLLYVPYVVNLALSILTCFFGIFFYIDSQNYYQRGEFFWFSAVVTYGYFIYSMVYLFANRKKTERNMFISLLVFTLPPVLGSIIQVLHFGFALIWPGVTISLVIIFINIQKNQLYTDHLTGLYNRRLLDIHLNDCLRNNMKSGSIGVIMFDIDSFKLINDAYGHVVGDQALVETANILKKSIGRAGFTARYGGDEFVAVVPVKDSSELESIAGEIEKNIETFNMRDSATYTVRLSMGYEIFECGGSISQTEVLSRIDRQMYDKKFRDRVIVNQMIIQ
ncbi:MAG: diguanylate cyclase [Oscillospiraceae bacterium]